ncbi:AmmeMemoRadiSam system radical SAM enzyme [bacterium]|nr:AmmeMemoRadiSam system radical SAM enzyme [bacterium]
MDQKETESLKNVDTSPGRGSLLEKGVNRRQAIKYGIIGLAGLAGVGSTAYYVLRSARLEGTASVFKNDAPKGELWELWKKRGWVKEAYHYRKLGRNVQCQVCPNKCVLEPGDRSHCRNKVNKGGKLYTLAFGNPCAIHIDPIEKKPLLHFLPGTPVFSIATSGCSLRCLNCQNWDISQKKPEETKDARGEEVKLDRRRAAYFTREDMARLSMFPGDVVKLAEEFKCRSIAYTYSEPTSFYEYMLDTGRLARSKEIKNVWVTNGYIEQEPLRDLCQCLDAANVDLKSFSEKIYRKLNSGKLRPVLETLKTLKEHGVWFEITNLIVPTYTDKLDMIRRMCDWLLENIGPGYPLHFSRFHPQHKLDQLPPTPVGVLMEARSIAQKAGLQYVYVGNVRGIPDAETTFCPNCKKAVVERTIYLVRKMNIEGGKCKFCGTKIAGVWTA